MDWNDEEEGLSRWMRWNSRVGRCSPSTNEDSMVRFASVQTQRGKSRGKKFIPLM
jgi:hypothetical protein